MPEAILIPRPASPEPLDQQSQARERLRSAIAALQEDSDRIAALESGRQRASENQRTAQQALIEAESALQQAGRIEPEHLAYSFIAGETIDRLPIAEAQAQFDRAKSELEHIEEIQQALESEIQRAQGRLHLRRASQNVACGDRRAEPKVCRLVWGFFCQVVFWFVPCRLRSGSRSARKGVKGPKC